VAGATLTLAACGLLSGEEARPCPRVAVIVDAANLTVFTPGPGRDLIDVQYEAEVAQLATTCRYDRNSVTSTVPIRVIATRGPAAQTNQVTIPFFVAIAEGRGNVLGRERFESTLVFQGNQRRAGVVEEIEQIVRLRTPTQNAAEFDILIGLELTPDQLQFNRQRLGRR